MVWTAEDSPLYKCVEKFNSTPCGECPPKAPEPECSVTDKKPEPQPECCSHAQCSCPEPEQKRCERSQTDFPRRNAAPAPPPHSTPGSLLQKITGDRDFMLIAALIILLLHEKADMKLIAALAFIILT